LANKSNQKGRGLDSIKLLKKAEDALNDAVILFDYKKKTGPINRLYYCSLYCAKSLLALEDKKLNSHSSVIGMFGNLMVKKNKFPSRYGRFLNKIYDLRRNSDYYTDSKALTRKEIKALLATANKFLATTKKYIEACHKN